MRDCQTVRTGRALMTTTRWYVVSFPAISITNALARTCDNMSHVEHNAVAERIRTGPDARNVEYTFHARMSSGFAPVTCRYTGTLFAVMADLGRGGPYAHTRPDASLYARITSGVETETSRVRSCPTSPPSLDGDVEGTRRAAEGRGVQTVTRAVGNATLFLLALSLADGCDSNTGLRKGVEEPAGLAGTTGTSTGSTGVAPRGTVDATSTGSAGTGVVDNPNTTGAAAAGTTF
jgi:hypothetical protein